MKRFLLVICIIVFLFSLFPKAEAQTQTVANGASTTAVNFPGTGCTYNWVNNTPGIGLAASGTGNIASFTAVNTGSTPLTATITATPVSAGFAYIGNSLDNTASVINLATNAVVATIGVGPYPWGTVVSPDGGRVYVTNNNSNTVSVINTASNAVVSTITVGANPGGVCVSPDGSRVYVENVGSGTVSVIDATTNTVVGTIAGTNTFGIAVSPDGSLLYVANTSANAVSVINTATNAVVATIPVPGGVFCLSVSPDGSRLYVTNNFNTFSAINTATNAVIATISSLTEPVAMSVSPDGSRVYVAIANGVVVGGGSVLVIDAATDAVISTIPVGSRPVGVSVSPDGSRVYAVNQISNNISVINTATNAVIATVNVGSSPISIGNFTTGGAGCIPVTFTVTVNPSPTITAGPVSGHISACAGTASASPKIQQFTVSGGNLTGDITAAAPPGFEVSLAAGSGYGNNVTLTQAGGTVNNTPIYVRSAAAASGNISGNVVLASTGAASQNEAVTGTINALPTVNAVANQTVLNGTATAAVNFTGTANIFNWVNDTPGIGLAASGTGNIASFTAVNTGSSPVVATITATPVSARFAYVANYNSNNVSVINTTANTVVATIPVGANPWGVSVSLDGSRAYVTNTSDHTVSVINTATNTVIATIPVGSFPNGIWVTPDGSKVYVANSSSGTVSVINTITNTVSATITVGAFPFGLSVTPDGSRVYVANYSSSTVSVINTTSNAVIATIATGPSPEGVAVSPDGSLVYVTNHSPAAVTVISTATNTVVGVVSTIPVGSCSNGITVSPDGSLLYVANDCANTISIIDATTYALVATIPEGGDPSGIWISPDGSLVYAVIRVSNQISVISTSTNAVVATVNVGSSPVTLGNFVTGTGCSGTPVTFTITVNPPPTITATGALSALSTAYGTASSSATFDVSGANMTAGILVTPPPGFEVSTDNLTFSNTVTVGAAGTIASTPVYVRLAATTAIGNYSGNIVLSSAGAASVNFATVNSIVTALPPTITAGPVSGHISACAGTASASPNIQQFTVSGSNLTANITATAPAGFEVSLVAGSGYGNSVTLTQAGGTVNSTSVYVRSAATASGNISGNVVLASTGAANQNEAVTGTINALPMVNAVASQTVLNGTATTAVNFTGTANTFTWVNNTPGIGLVASGAGNIASFTAVNTGSTPVVATITATPVSAGFAYIANHNSNNVSVINTTTNTVVATIPVGTSPYAVSLSPDGSRVYVANISSSTVSVINTATNAVVSSIPVGAGPDGVSVSPDGSRVYVANEGSNTVSVINTATNAVVSTIPVGSAPGGVAVSPDGSQAYVANVITGTVSVINTATNAVISSIPVGTQPVYLTVSPDGSRLYVTNTISNTVSVINTATNAAISTIPVGTEPVGIAVSPDGSRVYVANFSDNTISVINAVTNTVVATIGVSSRPRGIAVSPDGSRVYVTILSNTVVLINAATNAIVATINVGTQPASIGNFITAGGCSGTPVTFTITVNPTPAITASTATGNISACAGTASASPNIQQFTVSGSNLTANITAAAPAGFEVSLAAGSGYGNSVTLTQAGGTVNSTNVYVRSATTASGNISGSVVLASTGAASQNAAVTGTINALPTVNTVANQTVLNGTATTAVNFTGMANTFTWVNNTPGIGLAASGTGNIASFTAVNTGSSPVIATITATPVSTGFAYITNSGSNNVSVINTATNAVVATIPVGTGPYGASVSPDGSKLYVTNLNDGTVSVINTTTNAVIATITVGSFPYAASVSPDGSRVYVTNSSSGNVSVINTATNTVVASTLVGTFPEGVSVSADGNRVYVANTGSNTVSVINTTTNLVISTIAGLTAPCGIVISPDNSRVYVANRSSASVSVINTSTNAIIATIGVGAGPGAIAISPDGSRVYAGNFNTTTVSVINTATNTVIATIGVGNVPAGVSVTPDGSEAYVINQGDGTLSVINTATNAVVATVNVGSQPHLVGNFITGSGCSGVPAVFTITVNPSTPTITAAGSLPGLSTIYGTASASASFNVSGANMTAGILVSPPPGFEVSMDNLTFSGTVTVGAAGTIASTPVYIRLASTTAVGSYSGNVVLSSTGAANVNEATANSTVNPAPLTITANNVMLTYTNTGGGTGGGTPVPAITGGPGSTAFTVMGLQAGEAIGSVTITYGPGSNEGDGIGTYTGSVIPSAATGGTFAPGNYIITYLPGDIIINAPPTPVISATAVSVPLSALNTTYGTASVPNSFSVSGTEMLAGILVTPSPGFEVSTDNINFASTVTVGSAGTIASVPVYIRLTATDAVGTYGGGVELSSTGAGTFGLGQTNSIVNPAPLTITASDVTKTYGTNLTASPVSTAYTITGGTLQNGNTITSVSIVYGTGSAAGDAAQTYTGSVTISGGGTGSPGSAVAGANGFLSGNYQFTFVPGNIIVTPATLTITANNVIKPFGATLTGGPGSTAFTASGLQNGETIGTVTITYGAGSAAGDPAATYTGSVLPFAATATTTVFLASNYSFVYVPGNIIVTALPPTITAGPVSGHISACTGTPSASPNIQQLTVSGSNLTANLTATAPAGFEVSLTASSGYGSSVILNQAGGTVNNTTIYVRSAASASGNISGDVVLSSTGATIQNATVTGIVNALPTVNTVANQTLVNGSATTAVNFTGTANTFNWVNDTPGIGLPASGAGNIASFTAVNTGSSPLIATITASPITAGFAYITSSPSQGNGAVSVVNTSNNTIVATIGVGISPRGISASADGSRVYVANIFSNNVSVINGITNSLITNIPVGTGPEGVSVSLNGSRVYVANNGSNTVSVINTATNTVLATINVGSYPAGIAVSPDGTRVYVTNNNGNTISVINTTTNGVIATVPVGSTPFGVCVSPDGTRVYVANSFSNNISVISTATNIVTGIIPVGAGPLAIALSPDGNNLYVMNSLSYNVSVINTITSTIIATIPVSINSFTLSVSPDGSRLYVVNPLLSSDNISVINTATNTVIGKITVPWMASSFGNFITGGVECMGSPTTFTITVNPAPIPTITATGTLPGLSTTYGTASASASFNVSGANMTAGILVSPPPGFEVSTDNLTFSSTVTVGAAGTIASTPVYIRLASTTAVGSYSGNIVLSSAGAANVNESMANSTVTPAPITITANNVNKVYGTAITGSAGSAAYTITSGALQNGNTISSITIAYGTGSAATDPVNNYTGTVTASSAIGANGFLSSNYLVTYAPGDITVTTAPLTIMANNVTKTFGTALTGGTGSVAFTATGLQNSQTIGSVTIAYGSGSAATDPVGAYTVTVTASSATGGTFTAGNLPITYAPGDITVINAAPLTITANSVTKTFGTAITGGTGSAAFTATGLQNSQTIGSVTIAYGSGSAATDPVGAYTGTVTASSATGGTFTAGNYTITYAPGDITVTTAPLTITANSVTKTFGTAITGGTGSAAFTATGLQNSETIGSVTIAYGTGSAAADPVGTYTSSVTASSATGGTFTAGNYTITYAPGDITVTTAPLTITANSVTKTFGTAITGGTGSAAFTAAGLQNSETIGSVTIAYGTGSAATDPVGTYTGAVTASSATGGTFTAGNYAITYAPGDITVNAAPAPTIIASGTLQGLTTTYGTASASVSFNVSGANMTAGILVSPPPGFEVSTDNTSFSSTVTVGAAGTIASTPIYIRLASTTAAGSYSGNIVLSSAGAANVNIAMPVSFVNAALLTIIADNKSKIQETPNPGLTITYQGFVNNDGPAQLAVRPTVTTTANIFSAPGSYPITVDGAVSTNYTFSYVNGVLTINPALGMIFVPNTFTPNGDGINDTWNIKFLNSFPDCTVNIYNRYGERVYSSIGYGVPWDGTYNGVRVPTGVYYYIIDPRNGLNVLSGSITIIR